MAGQEERLVLQWEQDFEASPERLFAMVTDPVKVATWWGPRGFTTPEIQLDLRVGGRYRFTMQPPDGASFHLSGKFLEIDAPGLLSLTFNWDEPTPDDRETTVVLTFRPREDGTTLSLWQGEFATAERLELHRQGWADSFEKLREALETPGR